MFYQGVEQLIWSRYLSKVCIKSCFWIRYFIIIIPFKKILRDFLEFVSKSVHTLSAVKFSGCQNVVRENIFFMYT